MTHTQIRTGMIDHAGGMKAPGLVLVASAALLSAAAGQAMADGPVREFVRAPQRVTASEELQSRRTLITAADPRSGLLITPAPFPANRIDDPDRLENGRVWVTRGPVGSRTPIRESVYGRPGASSFGAGQEEIGLVIFVQPSELRSVVGISPFQQIDENTLAQIQRQEPNLGKTSDSPRSARLLAELRAAQHQWLEEQGYVLTVRTHVNPAALRDHSRQRSASGGEGGGEGATKPASIKPRAVIRVVPQQRPDPVASAETGPDAAP